MENPEVGNPKKSQSQCKQSSSERREASVVKKMKNRTIKNEMKYIRKREQIDKDNGSREKLDEVKTINNTRKKQSM